MKKILLLVLLFQAACTINLKAQVLHVMASSGGIFLEDEICMTWTMGETTILTMSAGDLMLTTGFHQPLLMVNSITPDDGLPFAITAFPNPTQDFVEVELKEVQIENMIFSLHDMNGKTLLYIHPKNNKTRIDLSPYTSGLYLLRVLQAEKEISTFEIIKLK